MNVRWLIVVAAVAFQGARPDVLPAAVTAAIERDRALLIELRRDLYQHPEVSGQEVRTAKVVADRLRALGLDVRTGVGGHGVVGMLKGGKPGPLVAYRADMDAVPSRAPDPVAFASLTPGVRHICGHDLHVTVALGLASALTAGRADLPGRVMFIFQPAEERATGARAMLDAGLFEGERPAVIFGLHTSPLPVGALTSKADRMMLANQVAPGVVNDRAWFARSRAALEAALGTNAFSELSAPPAGFSEDFGHFQAEVPGVFFFLGASDTAMPHAPTFVIDEGAINVGVRAMAAVVIDALRP
ncbi:MAG: hypothetical protein AMXMBFR57_08640 [Acidimicrobiia bacterium]